MTTPTFFVRDIPIYGDTILSPMAGYADLPFRAICNGYGSALQFSEFVAAEDILARNKRKLALFDFKLADRPPMVFQIFSNSAEKLLAAALAIAPLNPAIIDINMGCSTRCVSGRGAGVGMMKNPREVAKTFELLTKHLPMPITGKIRLGWDGAENFLEIGRIMQESGAAMVSLHPRTKEQKYSGEARWEAIGELKSALSIPVIGNGDIRTAQDIDAMLDFTGCDAVMIGRGAIGNPWLIGRIDRADLTRGHLFELIRKHAAEMVAYHGERGLILFRKHLKSYLQDEVSAEQFLPSLLQAVDLPTFDAILTNLKNQSTESSRLIQAHPIKTNKLVAEGC